MHAVISAKPITFPLLRGLLFILIETCRMFTQVTQHYASFVINSEGLASRRPLATYSCRFGLEIRGIFLQAFQVDLLVFNDLKGTGNRQHGQQGDR